MGHRKPVPTWVIFTAGAVATGAALLWTSTLYDSHGDPILDGPVATVLVGLLGTVGTVLALLLQRTNEVKHELHPNSGKSQRDVVDRIEKMLGGVQSDVRGIRRDVGRNTDRIEYIARRQDQINDRVDDIEDTIVPGKEK